MSVQQLDTNALAQWGAGARPAPLALAQLRALVADWDADARTSVFTLAGTNPEQIERVIQAICTARRNAEGSR